LASPFDYHPSFSLLTGPVVDIGAIRHNRGNAIHRQLARQVARRRSQQACDKAYDKALDLVNKNVMVVAFEVLCAQATPVRVAGAAPLHRPAK
jgi:hypothetical protein